MTAVPIQDARPVGSGHVCHHCNAAAEMQWPRHATDGEAAAHWNAIEANIHASGTPGHIQDRSSGVQVAVYGCGDHALGPICVHAEPAPVPCPVCHAAVGQPCIKPDGTDRPVEHPARAEAQPQAEACSHAHQADCGGYGACHCAAAGKV